MLNVLAGALVGGMLNVAGYFLVQTFRGEPIAWKAATASFVGGAAAGALAGATFGASLMGGSLLEATGFLMGDGAAGAAAETLTDNVLEKKPVAEGVTNAAVLGAVEAPLFFHATKSLASVIPELGPVLEGAEKPGAEKSRVERSRVEKVTLAGKSAARSALHYAKTAPEHHRSALAVAVSSQLQGWGGQLLQVVEGYALQVPDLWRKDAAPAAPATPAPTAGITGSLAPAR